MKYLMKTQFGSHLYGTNTAESDTDYKAVFVPSAMDILLQKATGVRQNNTKIDDSVKNTANDVDEESFTLHKFMNMLCSGDMIACELLFIPRNWLMVMSNEWDFILSSRNELISRDVKGFIGYCRKQAARYGIKGSRVAAMRTIKDILTDLPSDMLVGMYDWAPFLNEFIEIVEITLPNGHKMKYLQVCNRKLQYTLPIKEALRIVTKIFDEYGSRALQAEMNEGIDWKSLGHAVRVSQQAVELLETGHITFPRPNAEFLKSIRKSEHSYRYISEILEDNLNQLEDLTVHSTHFPQEINRYTIENIVGQFYLRQIRKEYN